MGVRLIGAPQGRPISGQSVVRQVPYALMRALNDTAFSARKEARNRFASVLDNPRRVTINSPQVLKATRDRLDATVWVEPFAGKGNAPAAWLRALELGGPRRAKRFEQALRNAGVLEPNEYAIPADGGSIDLRGLSGGNVGGIYTRMLAGLRANRDAADNTTERSKKRRGRRHTYFRRGNYIWERISSDVVRPILIIVQRAPVYQQMLGFSDTVERVAMTEMETWWRLHLEQALRTAR